MNNLLDIEIDYSLNINEYKQFCENLSLVESYINEELYLESMVQEPKPLNNFIHKIKDPIQKSRNATKDVKKIYSNITDGEGTLIRSIWDAAMKGIQLIARIIKYILMNLSNVPKLAIRLAEKISKIPENIRNRIRGNINLYITVNDVENIHRELIDKIDDFVLNADNISKGETWGTFFNRRAIGSGIITKFIFTENDIKYYNRMKSAYSKLKLINFKETLVKLEDQNIVDIYFGNTTSIRYKNSLGKNVKSNYYDALIDIFKHFTEQVDFLKRIQTTVCEKYDKSQMNQSFAKLSDKNKKIVSESIKMIFKVITVVGNLIKYSLKDINTLESSVKRILHRNSVKPVKGGKYTKESVELFEEHANKKCPKIDKETLRDLTPDEQNLANKLFGNKLAIFIMKDKHGYVAKTHRCRTDFYDRIEDIPKDKLERIASTD